MESEFLSLGLDIIGLGVFNYDFGCITKESPVIKVSLPPRPAPPGLPGLLLAPPGCAELHCTALRRTTLVDQGGASSTWKACCQVTHLPGPAVPTAARRPGPLRSVLTSSAA